MDFGFSLEQKSLGEVVGQVLAKFPKLTAPDYDAQLGGTVWNSLAEAGLFALLVPEAYGGVGLALIDLALTIEQLGGALVSPLVTHTLIATDLIVRFGTPAQQTSLLPAIAAGALRIALATHEAGRGTASSDCDTAFDGTLLDGCKTIVPDADKADWFVVLAQGGGAPLLALVARGAEGLTLRGHGGLDPSSDFCELRFSAVRCADEKMQLLGDAQAASVRLFDSAPALYAALQTGIAARMLDMSVNYARTRVQFGQPIGAFQAIKHRCADMAVSLDAGQSAAYYAIWAISEDAPDRSRASSMAKAFCGEVARNACNEAIQIHGGIGFTWELGLHRFLRRAKVLDQSFGSQEWHYERVMATTLAARDGLNHA
jgi:acyl-CoA dehydrogenase